MIWVRLTNTFDLAFTLWLESVSEEAEELEEEEDSEEELACFFALTTFEGTDSKLELLEMTARVLFLN